MTSCSQAVNKSPTHYPCDSARTFRVILFSIHNDEWKSFQCHHQTALRSYALSWKPCQGDSLNLPDHRIHKDGDGDASFQLKSDSLPHAHAQTTKTFYKHQDSRIMKAQELKTKTSAQTLIYKIFLQRYQVYQGRLLASFQDDANLCSLIYGIMAEVLINSLDAGNPLYLQNNDHYNLPIVGFKLTGFENYKMWSTAMKIALKGKNKICFIDGTCVKPVTSVVLPQQWKRCNVIVLGWILRSLSEIAYEV
ncbi:ribonuclease H-like domain-containing protein [Tanacetum coccineum]|uniref:Ribonuclease H-like domain-containing protein n=1 Tax=Tanacetum coccineum TaxID=301880 RepID=A0ABQ5ELU3_9ASTR